MRILHLSTSDIGGGAARAAFRLHTGLRRIGVDSHMLVLKKQSDEPSVIKLKWASDLPTRWKRSRRGKRINADFAAWQKSLPPWHELFSDDRSAAGYDLVTQLGRMAGQFDLINLHWVAGLIDYELFFPSVSAGMPLVWRLADMGAMTGGCHYDNGCGKFTARCGACPAIGSSIEDDLSRQIWLRKNSALAKVETGRLHLVGTSRWITAEARRSALLGRFASSIIPNGLDTEDFAPRDKGFARDVLGVPRDKKVVLFVADSATIQRKGFEYLAAALAGLGGRSDLFLLSVGGHAPVVSGLPLLHLGKISNDRYLSLIYSAADVFVIPSLQESFGQTVIESLACGTPVVGFNTGGIPDMVRPGITGQLAEVGNALALGDAIVRVLDDPSGHAAMSRNCRAIAASEYSMMAQATAYRALYEMLIAGKSVE